MRILADTITGDPVIMAFVIVPFVGLLIPLWNRSQTLIERGGVGVLFGLAGLIPFLLVIGWAILVIVQFNNRFATCNGASLCLVRPIPSAADAWGGAFEIVIPGLILVGIGRGIQALGEAATHAVLPDN
ncbi:MAG TPA: hypothetical protein VGR57_14225 [Ktedonobacterales bacterium]|nr:hypothetical protein [Ktedonobacterales bacterium]